MEIDKIVKYILIIAVTICIWPLYGNKIREFLDLILNRKKILSLKKMKKEISIEIVKKKLVDHDEILQNFNKSDFDNEIMLIIKKNRLSRIGEKKSLIKDRINKNYKNKLVPDNKTKLEKDLKKIFLID